MATTNISITVEAYNRLKNLRKAKESFSDIINRLTKKKDLRQFAGLLSKESSRKIEDGISVFRKRHKGETKKRIRRLVKQLR